MYKKIKELKDNTDTDFVFMDQRKCHEPDSVATTIEVLSRVYVDSIYNNRENKKWSLLYFRKVNLATKRKKEKK